MKFVCNSSPLIILSKLNALNLLDGYQVYIPQSVKDEILMKESAEKDVLVKFLKQKNIRIATPAKRYISSVKLGKGEIDVIHIAKEKRISRVLMDDRRARSHAKIHDLEPRGTIWLILQAYEKKKITRQKAKDLVYRLTKAGSYIAEGVIVRILEELG